MVSWTDLPDIGLDEDEHLQQLDFTLESFLTEKEDVKQMGSNMLA